jgi:hypothetical protein
MASDICFCTPLATTVKVEAGAAAAAGAAGVVGVVGVVGVGFGLPLPPLLPLPPPGAPPFIGTPVPGAVTTPKTGLTLPDLTWLISALLK